MSDVVGELALKQDLVQALAFLKGVCMCSLCICVCRDGGVGGIHVSGLGLSRYQNFSIRYQYMWISTILDTYPIR